MSVSFPVSAAIPSAYRIAPVVQREWLCDGQLKAWSGPLQEVLSPICEVMPDGSLQKRVIGAYPSLSEKESLEALDAAIRAYGNGSGVWPSMPTEERIRALETFVGLMLETRTAVVNLLMWEIGKSLADSEKEFDRTIEYVRDTLAALKDLDRASSRFTIEQDIMAQIRRAPLGVVLCMGPFNYPLNETFTTLIPALVMGNTVIFKPPKMGVLLHQPILEAFQKALPAGVVNSVYGDGGTVVTPLMTSGKIDCLAFIGTARVADILKHQHPKPHRLRCVLGLNAKNAAIVLSDADVDLAVKECTLGALSFNGQRCTGLKILFVHRSIAEHFLAKLTLAVNALKPGMPWEAGVQLTPLPEPGKPEWLKAMVDDAIVQGGRIVNPDGGKTVGTYYHPAIVYPVAPDSRLWLEEQFGPVVPVVPFDDISEPLNYVTDSDYGQQVSIFGSNPDTIATLVDTLVNQVCRVNINSQCQRGPDSFPFTGRKDSAEGTLSVTDALRVFSIRTLVAAKQSDINKGIVKTILRDRLSNFLSTDFIL